MLFCHLLIFFQNKPFQNILSETLSERQTDWIQIRTDLSGSKLFAKGYQQTTNVGASKERIKVVSFYYSVTGARFLC